MPPSTVTGVETVLSPETKDTEPVLPEEITGVWSVAVTVTSRVSAVLLLMPSLTAKPMLRLAVSGVMAVLR